VRCPAPAGRLCLALMERSRLLRVHTTRQDVFAAEFQSSVPCLWRDSSPRAPQANRAIGQSVLPQIALPVRKDRLRLAGRDQDASVGQELKPPSPRSVGPRTGAHHRAQPDRCPRAGRPPIGMHPNRCGHRGGPCAVRMGKADHAQGRGLAKAVACTCAFILDRWLCSLTNRPHRQFGAPYAERDLGIWPGIHCGTSTHDLTCVTGRRERHFHRLGMAAVSSRRAQPGSRLRPVFPATPPRG